MLRSKFQFGLLAGSCCSMFLIGVMVFKPSTTVQDCLPVPEPVYTKPVYLRDIDNHLNRKTRIDETLKAHRDLLSKELNSLKQKLGKIECEKASGQTSSAGGWCKKISSEDGGQHITDMHLLKKLSEFLKDKTVGSFGDGPGAYKREMLKLGDVLSYAAYDGAPYCDETSEGRVKFMDLTVPQFGLPIYDWIISLEVAEHIPKEYEAVYIDNIVRHSRDGVILSWAKPGQGGHAHVNNRPLTYVVELMKIHGFKHDEEDSKTLQLASSFAWLRDNVNVFRRFNSTNLEIQSKWFT